MQRRVYNVEVLKGDDDPQGESVGGDVLKLGLPALDQLVGGVELLVGLVERSA